MEKLKSEYIGNNGKFTIVVEMPVNDYSWFAVIKGGLTVVFTKPEESTLNALQY